MSDPKAATNDVDVSDDEKSSSASEDEKPLKKTSKKSKGNSTDDDETGETPSKAKSKRKSTPKEKSKKDKEDKSDTEEESDKVPLLDQPPIVEGSRSRKTVVSFESKVTVTKHKPIEIPNGKGVQLGRIPLINTRLKRLRQNVLKELHRTIFGKCGDPANFITNLQKFNGFPFVKDSDEYKRKLALFNKFPMADIKELLFFLDLDLKIKKKDDAVKAVLDFLVSPEPTENTQNAQPAYAHPKRKATKRNYVDADLDEADLKKLKKKAKAAKASKEEEEEVDEEEEEDDDEKKETRRKEPKARVTKNSEKEASEDEDESQKDEPESDDNSELKKPAKKRKRNQVIEEQEESAEETKSKKKKSDDKSKNTSKKSSASKKSASEDEEEEDPATELTDDELKNFLKKVLADANLEETTMKTVYGLISTHYPNYNFSKKKDFIKEVVKSLIQS